MMFSTNISRSFIIILIVVLVSGVSSQVVYSTDSKQGLDSGVVIQSLDRDGCGYQADLHPGERIIAWSQRISGSDHLSEEKGKIDSFIDWYLLTVEYAPRGLVTLTVQRKGKSHHIEVPSGEWGISVSPILTAPQARIYKKILKLQKKKKIKESEELWATFFQPDQSKKQWSIKAWALLERGKVLSDVRRFEQAAKVMDHARQLAQDNNNPVACFIMLCEWGKLSMKQYDFSKADEFFREARHLVTAEWDSSLRHAYCLELSGILKYYQDELVQANKFFKQALEQRKKLAPGSLELARSFRSLGSVYLRQGQLKLAETHLTLSLQITTKQAPQSLLHAKILYTLAGFHQDRANLDKADVLLEQAYGICRKQAPISLQMALILNDKGNLLVSWGHLSKAARFLQRALTLTEQLAPGGLEHARVLCSLGVLAHERGDINNIEKHYQGALAIFEKIAPEGLSCAFCYNSLAIAAEDRYDLKTAEAYYKKALDIKRQKAPGSIHEAASLMNLGMYYWNYDKFTIAEEYALQALEILEREAPNSLANAKLLNILGVLKMDSGDLEPAAKYYQRALAIMEKELPDNPFLVFILTNLGLMASAYHNYDDAERYYQQALVILKEKAPDSLYCARVYTALGVISDKQGNLEQAIVYHDKALNIRHKLAPLSEDEGYSLYYMGLIMKKQKKYPTALKYFQATIKVVEAIRNQTKGSIEDRDLLAQYNAALYREVIDVLLLLRKKEEAFNISEEFRARSLLNIMAERDLDFSKDVPRELFEEKQLLHENYDAVQEKIDEFKSAGAKKQVKKQKKKLLMIRQQIIEVEDKIKQASPHFAKLQYPQPLNLEAMVKLFEKDTLFLSYVVGNSNIALFSLFNGSLAVTTIPLEKDTFQSQVVSFRNYLLYPGITDVQSVKLGQQLYTTLLQPVQHLLNSAKRLLICPDGPLHILPFSSLTTPTGVYLIEQKPISYVISATIYSETIKKPSLETKLYALAAFGEPFYSRTTAEKTSPAPLQSWATQLELSPLPATRLEVENICRIFPGNTQKYLGLNASEEQAKLLGPDVEIIHFACHGVLDPDFPLNSGLVLSLPENQTEKKENGILQAWEIFETMRIDADLVCLSACSTGLGKEMGGEGLVSLNRAFLYAGAHAVLSTIWQVADESTAEFMKLFYTYRRQGQPKNQALRLTQLDFIHHRHGAKNTANAETKSGPLDLAHPFFWAGFVLNGDWH
ncbi:CHAT domain-containing protein [candidate division CSSED10-310 bacterium]|uniref:CHAT domain-containing protein n=1 Tax=candidate division CSSED10-310 bacterium TaxID=2855610 RepID=A0ABV6Z5E7_UNCC1